MDWIKISDRLPKLDESVLVYFTGGWHCIADLGNDSEYGYGWSFGSEGEFCRVEAASHWMPLPEPPKSVEST